MDAEYERLEQRKLQLLAEVAELEVRQQRQRGLFKKVPHFSEIEGAGHQLGQLLSRVTQGRMANEVAVEEPPQQACPECGEACSVRTEKRLVTGIDGPVELLEPKSHCPACRRDFFPSA